MPDRNGFGLQQVRADVEGRQDRMKRMIVALSAELPALPCSLFALNDLLRATPVELPKVAQLISRDPSLTAHVLRLCHTMLGLSGQTNSSIEDAVGLLGTDRIRTLALTCSLLESTAQRLAPGAMNPFWQHSLLVARLGEHISRMLSDSNPEKAYVAGLLHDLGHLAFLNILADENMGWDDRWGEGTEESMEAERQQFGLDHCAAGLWIGVCWNFPKEFLDVLQHHHHPEEATVDPQLVAIVAAADSFCLNRGVAIGGAAQLHDLTENEETWPGLLPTLNRKQTSVLLEELETELVDWLQSTDSGISQLR